MTINERIKTMCKVFDWDEDSEQKHEMDLLVGLAKAEERKRIAEALEDRNHTTIYYGKVMASQDNPMVSLKDVKALLSDNDTPQS